jgi:hypothetical protein
MSTPLAPASLIWNAELLMPKWLSMREQRSLDMKPQPSVKLYPFLIMSGSPVSTFFGDNLQTNLVVEKH